MEEYQITKGSTVDTRSYKPVDTQIGVPKVEKVKIFDALTLS